MELSELLKRISSLPWKAEKDGIGGGTLWSNGTYVAEVNEDNDLEYLALVANILPELVERLRQAVYCWGEALGQWCGLSDELRGKEKNWIHNSDDPEAKLYKHNKQFYEAVRALLDRIEKGKHNDNNPLV